MRTTVLKWLILILLLGYTAWMAVWANQEAGRHVCQGIDVAVVHTEAGDTVTRRGILDELSRYPEKIVGRQLSQINTAGIRRYLSRLSNLESVECMLTADRRLQINVRPMVPELRVFCGGKSWYVNKDGKSVPTNAEFYADVPVVSGKFDRSFTPRDVLPLMRFIRNDPELSRLTAMVVARDADNLIIVPRIHGHVVNFGDTSLLARKKRMLFAFYRNVMPFKGWNEYDTISVKFRNQIVATRRDKRVAAHGVVAEEEVDMEEATLPELEPIENVETE